MLNLKKTKNDVKKRVQQAQLGTFINLIHMDTPAEDIVDMVHLARLVSEEFDVDCRASDIERFYELDNWQENFEIESKKIEYGITDR